MHSASRTDPGPFVRARHTKITSLLSSLSRFLYIDWHVMPKFDFPTHILDREIEPHWQSILEKLTQKQYVLATWCVSFNSGHHVSILFKKSAAPANHVEFSIIDPAIYFHQSAGQTPVQIARLKTTIANSQYSFHMSQLPFKTSYECTILAKFIYKNMEGCE